MIDLISGMIRISNKCSCLEIFDQRESFKVDMIDLACGVIRISNKCSCLEIFDQQGNLNLTTIVVISYYLVSELSLGFFPYHWLTSYLRRLLSYLISQRGLLAPTLETRRLSSLSLMKKLVGQGWEQARNEWPDPTLGEGVNGTSQALVERKITPKKGTSINK